MAGLYFKSNQQNQLINSKYKKKYKRLKRIIKSYLFENAALCDQVAQIQENIVIIKDERRFLLKLLMKYEKDSEAEMLLEAANAAAVNSAAPGGTTICPENAGPLANTAGSTSSLLSSSATLGSTITNPNTQAISVPGKRGPKKRLNSDNVNTKNQKSNSANSNKTSAATGMKKSSSVGNHPTTLSTVVTQAEPTKRNFSMPIFLGYITLHNLGEIIPENRNFHTDNWMYPNGYTATRVYAHPKEPEKKCTFTCKILNNSGIPQFQIIPDSDFEHVFFGESANICHQSLLETIVRNSDIKDLLIRPQGEIFFGLGNPTVISLLQSSPNAKRCINFKGFQQLSVSHEEKDPTLNFDALQKLIAMSAYHTVPEIKEEPPDELLE